MGWPDFGAPTTTGSIITLAKAVRQVVELHTKDKRRSNDNVKILAHCSAGVGRTGTFVTLYQFMEILDQKIPEYKRLQLSSPTKADALCNDWLVDSSRASLYFMCCIVRLSNKLHIEL